MTKQPECAVILAAGEGKRLMPFTETNPKCCVEVGGRTILENALQAVSRVGCNKAILVTGHLENRVRETIGDTYNGLSIHYVNNPIYKVTNSMYSLFLGLEGIEESVWTIEGDVFFDSSVLQFSSMAEVSWVTDSAARHLDGAFLTAGSDGKALSLDIVRDLSKLTKNQYKSVGILRLTSQGTSLVRRWLQKGVDEGKEGLYYDLILKDYMGDGVIHVVDVAGRKWFEIDNMDDLEKARVLFGSPVQ